MMSNNGSNEENGDGWTTVKVSKANNIPSKSNNGGTNKSKGNATPRSGKHTNAKKANPQQPKHPNNSNSKKTAGKGKNQPQARKRKPTGVIQLGDLAPGLKQSSGKKNKKKNNHGPNQQPIILKKNGQVVRPQPQKAFDASEFPSLGGGPKPLGRLNPSASPWQRDIPPHPSNIESADTLGATALPAPAPATKVSIAPWAQAVPANSTPMLVKSEEVAPKAEVLSSTPAKKKPPKAKGPAPTKSKNQGPAMTKSKKGQKEKNVKTTVKVKPTASIADMFSAKPRLDDRGTGDELQLMRLMMEGKVASANKGRGHRQRVRPRKKKFSALKKKVLKERLRKWQELNPPESPDESTEGRVSQSSRTICIWSFAEADIVDDEDEYEELVNNLRDMASDVAPSDGIFIPRSISDSASEKGYPAFVRFSEIRSVDAALSCWDGLNLGGQTLQVSRVNIIDEVFKVEGGQVGEDITQWESRCLEWMNQSTSNTSDDENAQVIVENVLTEDDLDDEDCLEESLQDIRTIAENHGQVADIEADKEARSVIVTYEGGSQAAKRAAESLGKTVIGGSAVVARLKSSEYSSTATCHIILKHALSEEDLEDEDCLEESLGDLKELAEKYGTVVSLVLTEETNVKIEFLGTVDVAKMAAAGFQGMVMGGTSIEATVQSAGGELMEGESSTQNEAPSESSHKQSDKDGPLYSGDKLIGENWAECKRAPKVPNGGTPRSYATLFGGDEKNQDSTAKELLIEMLGELMRLQKRAVEEDKKNNTNKAKRRLVMGLREVAKGIRTHKIKMVVMANNLDDYGVIDDKLQEILDLAHEGGVPVFFEFSKRGLGKAIGKSIKVAVVGIQNPDGAHQPFKKLLKMEPKPSPAAVIAAN